MELTSAQVEEMAPDASSVKAGQKLGKPGAWQDTGRNDQMIWGQCAGSKLYDVKFDRSNFGYHCNCPSRKFPCKHVLGLLFLTANHAVAVPDTEVAPGWAGDWLKKRQDRAEKNAAAADKPKKPVDKAAQAKRAAARDKKVNDGLTRLDLWLQDLIRGGLAGLETKDYGFWNEQAKRLNDAQAPSLANRVEQLGEIPGSGRDWPSRLLMELGRLKLIVDAYQRVGQSGGPYTDALRQQIGFTVSTDELGERGETLTDRWSLVGQTSSETSRMRTQVTWFVGHGTGRTGYVLQFAVGNRSFEQLLVPGTEYNSPLTFYPGDPQRAKLGESEKTEPISERLPGHESIDAFLDAAATAWATNPWADQILASLQDVSIQVSGNEKRSWTVNDGSLQLPLTRAGHWNALAVSGGRPVDLFGTWDGLAIEPLGMVLDGQYRRLP